MKNAPVTVAHCPTRSRHSLMDATPLSRRAFLKAGVCGLSLGAYAAYNAVASESSKAGDRIGVLVDLTRCIGCRACENACRVRAGFSRLPTAAFGYGAGEGKLTFETRTFVDFPKVQNGKTTTRALPVKKQCMHCVHPACVSACPVAALVKTPEGPVIYNEKVCIGCRYCILACPFDVPKYEWDNALMPRVGKCDMCYDRITNRRSPACVAACPTGALKFGKFDALLQEARARISSQPKRYVALFGDKIVGGTSWLYLSDTPMEKLGFRTQLPDTPLPSLTWRVISKVPFVIVGVGLLLSVIFRLRSRKQPVHTAHGA